MKLRQNNLNGGILSEWLYSREDLSKHQNGLAKCRNFILSIYGAVRNRMGFEYIAELNSKSNLIKFQVNEDVSFIFAIGDYEIKIFKNGSSNSEVTLVSPWSSSEAFELNYTKLNETMLITHGAHKPREIKYDGGVFTIQEIELDYPPFLDENLDETHKLQVTPQGNADTNYNVSVLLQNYNNSSFEVSDTIVINGVYSVDFTGIVSHSMSNSYLLLEKSVDNGVSWVTLQTIPFTSPTATVSGTSAGTGLMRIKSSHITYAAEMNTTVEIPALSTGDTVNIISTKPVFNNLHIGAEFELSAIPSVTEVKLSLTGTNTSPWLQVKGSYRVFTSGNWTGTIVIQTSSDNGVTIQNKLVRTASNDRALGISLDADDLILVRILFYYGGVGANNPHAYIESNGALISGRVEVTSVTNSLNAVGVIKSSILNSNPTETWKESAWSDFRGYPRAVAWHESRMFYAGSKTNGTRIWASKTDDFYNFESGVNDDNSFYRDIGTTGNSDILWLASQDYLYIGNTGEEWIGRSDSDGGIITPSSFLLRLVSKTGSEKIQPVFAGSSIVHVQRQGRSLFRLASSATNGQAIDLCRLAPTVTQGRVTSIAYQATRDPIVWGTRGDGILIGNTFSESENVSSWHEHSTDGKFISVATIYENGEEDTVYCCVERGNSFYLERMVADQYEIIEQKELVNCSYLDSFKRWSGQPSTVISGFDHLNGKQVSVIANGILQPNQIVSGGTIILQQPATSIIVGLPYESFIELLPILISDKDGRNEGKYTVLKSVIMKVFRSVTADASCNRRGTYKWETMRQEWRNDVNTDEIPAPGDWGYLETWEFPVNAGHDQDSRISVRNTKPFPLNILSLTGVYN